MPSFFGDVKAFDGMFRDVPERPEWIGYEGWARRLRLILEELSETATAYAVRDEAEFADGLVDLVWVVLETAAEAGLPFDELWGEVRDANMRKKGGRVDPNGKLHKPAGWAPPDIRAILARTKLEREGD